MQRFHIVVATAAALAAPLAARLDAQQPGARVVTGYAVYCPAGATITELAGGDVDLNPPAQPVGVNVGGGSQPITTVNTTSGDDARVSNGKKVPVDTTGIDNPARNSDQRAVRVNVGGGSVPLTKVNDANTGRLAPARTVTAPACYVRMISGRVVSGRWSNYTIKSDTTRSGTTVVTPRPPQ